MPQHRSLPRTGGRAATAITVLGLLLLALVTTTGWASGARKTAVKPGDPPSAVYVVPSGAASDAALATPGVRIIARYKRFLLVEAAPSDAETLVAAGAVRRDDMRSVRLQSRSVDPAAEAARGHRRGDRSGVPSGHKATLVVVQFIGPPKDDWIARLRATGVRIVSAMAENAQLVHAKGQARAALRAYVDSSGEVRGAFVLAAKDKLAPQVATSGRVRVTVQTLSGEDGERARELTERLGTTDGPGSDFGPYTTLSARIDASAVDQLTADAGVVAVEATPTPRLLDERQGLILANGDVAAGPGSGYLAAHDAALFGGPEIPATLPFVVDLTDSAIGDGTTTPTHDDLREDGAAAGAARLAYVHKLSSEAQDPAAMPGLRRARDDQRQHRRRLERRLGRDLQGRRGLPLRARRRAARAARLDHALRVRRRLQRRRQELHADGRGFISGGWARLRRRARHEPLLGREPGGRRLRRDGPGVRCDRA